MKFFTKILLAAALVSGAGQTQATTALIVKTSAIETQDRHLSGFSAVDIAGSFDVYLTQGGSESVKVEADADVIDKIVTEVSNGVLKIYTKNSGFNWSWGNKKRLVRVVAKDLKRIALTGSGDVFFKEGFRTQALTINLTGSGDMVGKIDVKNLESSLSGSGDVTLSGRAETSSIRVAGSGDFDAHTLVTTTTTVKVAGSGDASVNASQQITAVVTGSGDIRYTGGAKQVSSSKTGSGDISKY